MATCKQFMYGIVNDHIIDGSFCLTGNIKPTHAGCWSCHVETEFSATTLLYNQRAEPLDTSGRLQTLSKV